MKTIIPPFLQYFKKNLHSSAPKELLDAVQKGEVNALWQVWSERVTQRALALGIDKLSGELLWGITADNLNDFRKKNGESQKTASRKRTSDDSSFGQNEFRFPSDSPLALLDLAYENALVISQTSPEKWLEYIESVPVPMENADNQWPTGVVPLESQIIRGELRLLLGLLYSDLTPFAKYVAAGKKTLVSGITDLIDSRGFPRSEHLPVFRQLAACWSRSLLLANSAGITLFPAPALRRFEWVLLEQLRLTQPNGEELFPVTPASSADLRLITGSWFDMLETAFPLDSDPGDLAAAVESLAPFAQRTGRKLSLKRSDDLPPPDTSCGSDDSAIVALRNSWRPRSTSLFFQTNVATSTENPQKDTASVSEMKMQLYIAGKPILSGNWDFKVSLDGEELLPTGPWSGICEEYETSYSCVEWELPLTRGYRLERIACIFCDENILLLGDALLAPKKDMGRPRTIDYLSSVPVCPGEVRWKGASRFRDMTISENVADCKETPIPLATVLPLCLNEWKSVTEEGSFGPVRNRLVLQCHREATALFAPVVIDFDTRRHRTEAETTWRYLTVGQDQRDVTGREAVAWRFVRGDRQYLLYRSLREPANRTFLGHNLTSDFMFAKFGKDYGVASIVDLE